jgi:hypothetical protein
MDVRGQSVDHDCILIRGLLKRKLGPRYRNEQPE